MWGNSGNDTMSGGNGDDIISGGKGNDVISDDLGNDTVTGNSGDDRFIAGEGNDSYDGGSGFDTIDYSGSKRGMIVDLNAHTASGMGADSLKGVEGVLGSAFADSISGDKNANVLVAGAGDDTLRGRGGADVMSGGAGRDTFTWSKTDVNAVDHITDFAKGDRLNLHDLIKGQKFSSIADVVKVTDGAAGSTVSVKYVGAFHDVVTLDGVHNTSAVELLKAGMILS
jgi:Ca2+-binding RTX toxin-like protein